MNAFVIVGQRHGSEKPEQIGGLIAAPDWREAFADWRIKNTDSDYQRVWVAPVGFDRAEWDVRLSKPEPVSKKKQ